MPVIKISIRGTYSIQQRYSVETVIAKIYLRNSINGCHNVFVLLVVVNWLDHSKTLREQGIDVNETLLLRRKFFFSDQNVDARDPVQLNLLYVQVRYNNQPSLN